jgi:hypothetical protein
MRVRSAAILCLFLVLSLPVLSQQGSENQVASWEPKFGFDYNDELFPSFVLAMTGRTFNVPATVHYYGDALGMAEVWVRPAVPNAKAHVEVQIEGLTGVSELDVTLPDAGQVYRLAPMLHYDFSHLAQLDQSVPAVVTYSVRVNGADLGRQSRSIRVRSVNDVPFEVMTNGKQQDFSFLFAAFVNESHPFVQAVLQEALHWHAVNSFSGYQGSAQDVRMQVFAVWNVLQRRHLRYSSITTPSAASPTSHIYSQSVRFIDQSIESQQANCVDGSVLFASVLYKIGIHPILVMKPGHMFVGYYLDEGHKQFEFLETTMLGAGSQPGAMNIGFSPLLHPVQGSQSWQQFAQALQYATNTFNQEVLPAMQQHKAQYRLIEITKARQFGVNAIPRTSVSINLRQ